MGQDHRIPQKPRPRAGVTYRHAEKLRPYADALSMAGMDPVPIHPDDPLPLDGLDGLLISGGSDLNARLYGAEPHPSADPPDDARDALERRLLEEALERDVPVLCICRGMQLFNVVHGGTLIQDVDGHRSPGVDEAHRIEVTPGTLLSAILQPGTHAVNSRHHQAIDQVGRDLTIAATSQEGHMIEALERAGRRFAVAVQWHPEDLVNQSPVSQRLFAAFARAAGAK